MAEFFPREKLRHASQKEGGWKSMCDLPPVWPRLVCPTNLMYVQNEWEGNTHILHSLISGRNPPSHSFFFFFSLISLIGEGPLHYHIACGHKGSSHLSPVHALQFFIAMQVQHSSYNSSTNQWLNFTYSRSHAFRYERKNTNPTLLVRIELTTSALTSRCAGYLLDHSGDNST